MSFEAKSTAATLVSLLAVYGWYFVTVFRLAAADSAGEPAYRGLLLVATIAFVVIVAVSHILLALASPKSVSVSDERDRLFDVRGEAKGGIALAGGVLVGLALVLMEAPMFWVAQTLMASLVLGEIVKAVFKLVDYGRGV